MRLKSITPEFVEFIPRELKPGLLYISERFNTASHLCACGCGEKVVTPLSPASWKLEKHSANVVSLNPSIGNWNYACRSHYWIRKNRIEWAAQMSQKQIAYVQKKDLADQAKYVENVNKLKSGPSAPSSKSVPAASPNKKSNQSFWQQILRRLGF